MTRLTYLPGCLLVALNLVAGIQGASATGVAPGMQQQVQLQTSIARETWLPPSEPEDDWSLKKMLLPPGLKHLDIDSDLKGLADSAVSQPEAPL